MIEIPQTNRAVILEFVFLRLVILVDTLDLSFADPGAHSHFVSLSDALDLLAVV